MIPVGLQHIIPQKFQRKHDQFVRKQVKRGPTNFVYMISYNTGIGITVTLKNEVNSEVIDLTDYDTW